MPRGTSNPPRSRTIVVAASADPTADAAVPLVGFHIADEIGRLTDSVLVANALDREGLLTALPAERVRFAGSASLARVLRRLGTALFPDRWGLIGIVELPGYLLFDLHAFVIVRRLLRQRPADYVLRVNPITPQLPSLLPRLPVPVVTGPHNGGMDWPAGFRQVEAAERTGHRLRFLGDWLHRLYGDHRRYALILVGTETCARSIPAAGRARTALLPENGVESPEALVGDLVRNVEELLADPARGAEIGRRSREVVRSTYLWSSKARAINALARAAIADRT